MAVFLTILFLLLPISASALTPEEILEASDAVMHPDNLRGEFSMVLISQRGDTRTMRAAAFQKRLNEERENRLFLFTFPPPVEGTGLLILSHLDTDDDTMWLYLPAIGRIKRVNLNTSGSDSFMGSDFTYNDLLTTGYDEFDMTPAEAEPVGGWDCLAIELKGKTREIQRKYGYSREIRSFRKPDYVHVRSVFYDLAGDLLKVFTVDEVTDLGDSLYPSKVRMENRQTGHSSVIDFGDLTSPESLPDGLFTHRYLEHQRVSP